VHLTSSTRLLDEIPRQIAGYLLIFGSSLALRDQQRRRRSRRAHSPAYTSPEHARHLMRFIARDPAAFGELPTVLRIRQALESALRDAESGHPNLSAISEALRLLDSTAAGAIVRHTEPPAFAS
jgi:hypothetical protein